MKRNQTMGAPRLIRRRAQGQSIPLIALMIVVLVAMVGLSVDVGNTFAEEREAVAAANAAAIAGMNALLDDTGATTNLTVYTAIINTLRANGIDINSESESRRLAATYLNAQGVPITSASPDISNDGPIPQDAAYVQVKIDGEVNTFFARVVNRNDLPLNANAYAGRCPSGFGVYPIGVDSQYIRDNEFIEPSDATPWGRYEGGPYDGMTWRRMYARAVNTPGSFGWLRWMEGTGSTGANANSNRELAASLGGFGSMGFGFNEVVPWPNSSLPEPATYPERPGELNPGDWVHGSSGWNNSTDQRAAIEAHMTNGTQMILPIYDEVVGGGSNAAFHVVRMGLFVIIDRGRTGSEPWFDMVFLGDADRLDTACAATPPPPTNEEFELWGSVGYFPQYPERPEDIRPVQYMVVFDTSGSMNMNFAGQGWRNNQIIQCTNGPSGSPPSQDCGLPTHAWPEVTQRRIYVAKEAIRLLIDETNMPGNADYDPTKPRDSMALVWFNGNATAGWTHQFSSDPTSLKNAVLAANRQGNDPYKSEGGTNGAGALYRAADILQNAPKDTAETGQTIPYKRVVIFITDGVSNVFLDTSRNSLNGGTSDETKYPTGHVCKVSTVKENAECQTTGIGGKWNNWDRPITQMVNVSRDLIKNNEALKIEGISPEVYVLALSNIPATGLEEGVATATDYFKKIENFAVNASGLTTVDEVMLMIKEKTNSGACVAQSESFTTQMTSSYFQPWQGLSYPDVGKVVITDSQTGVSFEAPVRADNSGKLSYRFTNIPRGTYQLVSYIWLSHPEDEGPRLYGDIYANEKTQGQITVVVDRSGQDVGGLNVVQQDVALMLTGNVCADTSGE